MKPLRWEWQHWIMKRRLNKDGFVKWGGGRQSAFDPIDGLDAAFLRVLEQHTTDSPIDETVKWTHLKRHAIGALLREAGIEVSVTVVAQLLEQHNFRKRKAVKTLATGKSEHRNEQFERSEQLKGTYQAAGTPIMSMDTKKEKCVTNCIKQGNCTLRIRESKYSTMMGHR